MAVQSGLCGTRSKTRKNRFSHNEAQCMFKSMTIAILYSRESEVEISQVAKPKDRFKHDEAQLHT